MYGNDYDDNTDFYVMLQNKKVEFFYLETKTNRNDNDDYIMINRLEKNYHPWKNKQ